MNKPQKRKTKYMYGKFHHDFYEFNVELRQLLNIYVKKFDANILTGNELIGLRNEVVALVKSWISSKRFEAKFGIKLPLHTVTPSLGKFIEKQARSFHKIYEPCEICGEKRISNYCHIIPNSQGGPPHEDNYVCLCPTHHHLFDHNRLAKDEWEKIDFNQKMPASQEYAEKIRLPVLINHWSTKTNSSN